jgi:hypothetical protein
VDVWQQTDLAAIANGITTIETANYYASYMTRNGTAFAVAKPKNHSIIAANRYGTGRVIQFGHESMMSSCCSGSGLGGLVGNAAQWAAGGKAVRIRVASGNSLGDGVRNFLMAKVSLKMDVQRSCPSVGMVVSHILVVCKGVVLGKWYYGQHCAV